MTRQDQAAVLVGSVGKRSICCIANNDTHYRDTCVVDLARSAVKKFRVLQSKWTSAWVNIDRTSQVAVRLRTSFAWRTRLQGLHCYHWVMGRSMCWRQMMNRSAILVSRLQLALVVGIEGTKKPKIKQPKSTGSTCVLKSFEG